jgi:hypothetical protein
MSTRRFDIVVSATLATLLLGVASLTHADTVTISLVTNVTGPAGSTITVFGNLTNTTTGTQYFGNDAINLTAPSSVATASDDIILNGLLGTGPTSIGAGATLSNVDLFSVQILGGAGTYAANSFQLFGGTDAVGCANGAADCNNLLGTANFSLGVTAVPVPAAGWLFLSGVGGLLGFAGRRPR